MIVDKIKKREPTAKRAENMVDIQNGLNVINVKKYYIKKK